MSAGSRAWMPRLLNAQLYVRTEGSCGFHDLTDDLDARIAEWGLSEGILLVMSLHTTAGLLLNERETGFRKDFELVAERIVPRGGDYAHDDFSIRFENLCPEDEEFPNGHSHVQHTIFGAPSLTLPVENGTLVLGAWQRVFLIEFDRPRDRYVRLQAFGMVNAEPEVTGDAHAAVANANGQRRSVAVPR